MKKYSLLVIITAFAAAAVPQHCFGQPLSIPVPETVPVEPGTFTMGMDVENSPYGVDGYTGATPFKESPAHRVVMTKPYAIGKYEVTNREFAAFVDAGGYAAMEYWIIDPEYNESPLNGWNWKIGKQREAPGHSAASWDLSIYPYWKNDPYSNQADTPVIGVCWYEAYAYCKWLSDVTGATYRLPTEAEWEYAARGPASNVFPWGNDYLDAHEMCGEPGSGAMANCCSVDEYALKKQETSKNVHAQMDMCDGVTQPVGSYPDGASYWGACDMAGNVAELTADWFRGYYYPLRIASGETIDPRGPSLAVPPFFVPVAPFWIEPARTQRSTSYKMDSIGADNYSPYGPTYPLRCSHRMFGFRYMGSSMVGFRILKEGR